MWVLYKMEGDRRMYLRNINEVGVHRYTWDKFLAEAHKTMMDGMMAIARTHDKSTFQLEKIN